MANQRRTTYDDGMYEGRKMGDRDHGCDPGCSEIGAMGRLEACTCYVAAISDSVRWAEEIMRAIDERFPARKPDEVMR